MSGSSLELMYPGRSLHNNLDFFSDHFRERLSVNVMERVERNEQCEVKREKQERRKSKFLLFIHSTFIDSHFPLVPSLASSLSSLPPQA